MKKKSKYIFIFFVIVLVFFAKNTFSQSKLKYNANIMFLTNSGLVIPEYQFFNLYSNAFTKGFDICYSRKLDGHKTWHQLYNYPNIGFEYSFSTLSNKDVFGSTNNLYVFYNIHLFAKQKVNLNFGPGFGGSYVTKIYNQYTNFRNIAVATHLNFYFHFNTELNVNLSKKIKLVGGLAFNHFSNASFKQPNIGLNYVNVFTGLNFILDENPTIIKNEIKPIEKRIEKYFIFSSGLKSSQLFESYQYLIASFSFDYTYIVTYKYSVALGTDIFYDGATRVEMERAKFENIKNIYSYKSGIHCANELNIGKMAILVQAGIYLGLTDKLYNKKMYNRLAIKYKLTNHLLMQMSLKTHSAIADFMEFGFGYYL